MVSLGLFSSHFYAFRRTIDNRTGQGTWTLLGQLFPTPADLLKMFVIWQYRNGRRRLSFWTIPDPLLLFRKKKKWNQKSVLICDTLRLFIKHKTLPYVAIYIYCIIRYIDHVVSKTENIHGRTESCTQLRRWTMWEVLRGLQKSLA